MAVITKQLDVVTHSDKAKQLVATFAGRIIGQPEAVAAYTNVLEKYLSGMYDRTRPLSNLLYLGPTGTGKTSSAEAFAYGLHGDDTRLLKIDCGEFQHSHDIAKLVGSPPGYLGHRETSPLLTNKRLCELKSEGFPFAIIVFDEIEKASDSLWNLLLGILDKGSLTTGTNEPVNELRNSVIVMTSNVGSKEMSLKTDGGLGFFFPSSDTKTREQLSEGFAAAAKRKFLPEFLNRLDEVIMFNSLTEKHLQEIIELELKQLQKRVIASAKSKVYVRVSPAAKTAIVAEGYDKKQNARNLKRAVERRVGLPVQRAMTTAQVKDLDSVVVDYKGGAYVYFVESSF
jgi:ATP-dependent Clp protease ATP-binding subunit ClpA